MRTYLLSALGLVALVGSVAAQPLPTEIWGGGVIVNVDSAARTLAVRQGASEQTYVLAADAEVKDGKKVITSSDLAATVGQQVRLKYVVSGDTRTVSKVNLLGIPKTGSAAAASASALKGAPATTPE